MSKSNDATRLFQMIEAAARRNANDNKRLQELKKLKRRVEEEIEDYGSPPPEEVVERLLSLIERGALPSEEQVLNVVENFLNSQQTTSETNEGNFIQDAEDLIDRGETDKALHLLEESVSRMPRNWKPFVRKPPQPRRDEANGSETPRKWKPIVVQLDGEIAFWDEEEFQSYSDYVRGQVREDAIKSFLWISPSYSKAHYLIASLAIDQGDFKKALNALDAGLALEPDHPDLMCEKAYLLKELGRREDALAYYQSAASARLWITDSAKARALRGQGRILIDLGRLDEAEEAFKQSLTLEPESKLAREGIAFIEKHQQMSPDTSRHRQANRETVGSITHKPVSRQVAPSPPSLKRPSKQGPNLRPVAPTETARSLKRRTRQVALIAPSRTNTFSKHRKIWFVIVPLCLIGVILLFQKFQTSPRSAITNDAPYVRSLPQETTSREIEPPIPQTLPLGSSPFGKGVRLGSSTITVKNGTERDALVKVVRLLRKDQLIRNFYIPADTEFIASEIPPGEYVLRVAFGRDWNRTERKFNFRRAFSETEHFDITEEDTGDGIRFSRMTITLHKVVDGNFRSYEISEEDFSR